MSSGGLREEVEEEGGRYGGMGVETWGAAWRVKAGRTGERKGVDMWSVAWRETTGRRGANQREEQLHGGNVR